VRRCKGGCCKGLNGTHSLGALTTGGRGSFLDEELRADIGELLDVRFRGKTLRVKNGEPAHSNGERGRPEDTITSGDPTASGESVLGGGQPQRAEPGEPAAPCSRSESLFHANGAPYVLIRRSWRDSRKGSDWRCQRANQDSSTARDSCMIVEALNAVCPQIGRSAGR